MSLRFQPGPIRCRPCPLRRRVWRDSGGNMYAVYKQAHPPTGLEFAMYCNFFNNSERNLVVAGTSQLYVYRLNRDAEVGRVS